MTDRQTIHEPIDPSVVVLVCADAEWKAVQGMYSLTAHNPSPFGEWILAQLELDAGDSVPVVFFHAGWGKIAAAASTQYVIDRWHPFLVFNIGTCGGFAGEICEGEIILVQKTVVYDIQEQMGDPAAHVSHYTTRFDLGWLGENYPHPVIKATLVSGDRDLIPAEIPRLKSEFSARAGDWESAAIAWVAGRNNQRCLILRGVSDLVDETGSPAYEDGDFFERAAQHLMQRLVGMLPAWISLALKGCYG